MTNTAKRLGIRLAAVFGMGLLMHIFSKRHTRKGGYLKLGRTPRDDQLKKTKSTGNHTDVAVGSNKNKRTGNGTDVTAVNNKTKATVAVVDKKKEGNHTTVTDDKLGQTEALLDKKEEEEDGKAAAAAAPVAVVLDKAYQWNAENHTVAWQGHDGDALNKKALKDHHAAPVVESMRKAALEHYVYNLDTHSVTLKEEAVAPRFRKLQIAIACGATSHTLEGKVFMEMALGRILLPSVAARLETNRYHYALYVSVDEDDAFWQSASNLQRLERLALPSHLPIHVHAYPQKSPKRIPFNEVARQAYWDGADYLVRVNDDTEFITEGWTSIAISSLMANHPPNIGMVGPSCLEGNTAIMTHDLVYLPLHLHLFEGDYYPSVYTNWYVDDWISAVYGPRRTLQHAGWMVSHRVGHHGQRYAEDSKAAAYLELWVWSGRERMYRFMCPANDKATTNPDRNREWIKPLIRADGGALDDDDDNKDKDNDDDKEDEKDETAAVTIEERQERRALRAFDRSSWLRRAGGRKPHFVQPREPPAPPKLDNEALRPKVWTFQAPNYEDRFLLDGYVTEFLSPRGETCGGGVTKNVIVEYRQNFTQSVSFFMESVLHWKSVLLTDGNVDDVSRQHLSLQRPEADIVTVCTAKTQMSSSSSTAASHCQSLGSIVEHYSRNSTRVVVVLDEDTTILSFLLDSLVQQVMPGQLAYLLISSFGKPRDDAPTPLPESLVVPHEVALHEFCAKHKNMDCNRLWGAYVSSSLTAME